MLPNPPCLCSSTVTMRLVRRAAARMVWASSGFKTSTLITVAAILPPENLGRRDRQLERRARTDDCQVPVSHDERLAVFQVKSVLVNDRFTGLA